MEEHAQLMQTGNTVKVSMRRMEKVELTFSAPTSVLPNGNASGRSIYSSIALGLSQIRMCKTIDRKSVV